MTASVRTRVFELNRADDRFRLGFRMPAQGGQSTRARAEGRRPKASEERTRGTAARELAVYGDLVAPRRWRGKLLRRLVIAESR